MTRVTVRIFVILGCVPALLFLSGCGGPTSAPANSSSVASSPASASVGAFLRNDGRFGTLVQLMSAKDVPGHDATFLEVIDAEADPGTLFAPTDAAFQALGPGAVDEMLDAPWLTTVLEKHLAHGAHASTDLSSRQLQTWGVGSTITVEVNGGKIRYGGAQVIQRDIDAGSWVIHVIDGVVLPSFAKSELSS